MGRKNSGLTSADKPYIIEENGEQKAVSLEDYRKTKFDDIRVRVPKGKKEIINAALMMINREQDDAISLNQYIYSAIRDKILSDYHKDIDLEKSEWCNEIDAYLKEHPQK